MVRKKEDEEELEEDEEELEEDFHENFNTSISKFKPQESINKFLETQPITNLERDLQEISSSTEDKNEYKETQLNYLESSTSSYDADSTGYVVSNPQPNNFNIPGFQSEFSGTGSMQGQSSRKDSQYTPQALQREEQKGGIPPSRNKNFR